MSIYGTATVLKNFEIAQGIWQMELFAPQIATVASPGQFINLYPNDNMLLLPRPKFTEWRRNKNNGAVGQWLYTSKRR